MPKVPNLDDILPPELHEAASRPLDDFMDKDLIFYNSREVTGKHGPYARILVSVPGEEDQFYVATGASQPMEVLRWVKEHDKFPFTAHFEEAGSAIILKGS